MNMDEVVFKFDNDRAIIIGEAIGSGASCIAYKCIIKFEHSSKTSTGIMKEFAPKNSYVDLIGEDDRYRYLPAQEEQFIVKYYSYKDSVEKMDKLLSEIAKNDSTIEWYYDSSSIYDSSKNRIFELDKKNHRYRAITLLPYESKDASTTIHNFSIKERIDALARLCSVVEKFHDNNLILADLKPKNFLYGNDGITSRIKIIDFDSVLLTDDENGVKPNQSITGSKFFSSPEIRTIDCSLDMYARQSDVYSMGAILLNFVTIKIFDEIAGKYRWFESDYLSELDIQLNNELYEKLKLYENDDHITKGFWNKFVQIVLKSMSNSLENRYENMAQIRDELISLIEIYDNKGVHPEVMLNKAIDMAKIIKFDDIDEDLFTSIKEVDEEN